MRKVHVLLLVVAGGVVLALLGAARPTTSHAARSYVVVYTAGATPAAARDAVKASGGTIVKENLKVGVATAVSRNPAFLEQVRRQPALFGAAHNRAIGHTLGTPSGADLELAAARATAKSQAR